MLSLVPEEFVEYNKAHTIFTAYNLMDGYNIMYNKRKTKVKTMLLSTDVEKCAETEYLNNITLKFNKMVEDTVEETYNTIFRIPNIRLEKHIKYLLNSYILNIKMGDALINSNIHFMKMYVTDKRNKKILNIIYDVIYDEINKLYELLKEKEKEERELSLDVEDMEEEYGLYTEDDKKENKEYMKLYMKYTDVQSMRSKADKQILNIVKFISEMYNNKLCDQEYINKVADRLNGREDIARASILISNLNSKVSLNENTKQCFEKTLAHPPSSRIKFLVEDAIKNIN